MTLSLVVSERAGAAQASRILWTAEWKPDGSQFAVGGEHTLWVFESDTFDRKSLLPASPQVTSGESNAAYISVTSIAWHPSDDLLAASSQGPGRDVNGIYDLVSGDRIALREGFARGVSWSPKGDMLAIACDDTLKLFKTDGTLLHTVPRYREGKGLTGVSWRPSGDRIVTIGARITLHDAEGQPIKQMMHRPEAQERLQLLLSVAWHPSGDFFAVGDYGTELDDPVLQFWSAEGQLLKSIRIKGGAEMRNLSWSPDGGLLASASDKLRIWTREGELKYEGESPDLLWGVSWHPDGDTILTSSIEGRVTLWSSSAQKIREIVPPPQSKIPLETDGVIHELRR